MKSVRGMFLALALFIGVASSPSLVSADELYASSDPFGVIQTVAVTAPISFDWITYVPCSNCGGAEVMFLGTVETLAVTQPITVGGIMYIPPSE